MVVNAAGADLKDLTPGSNDVPPFSLAGQDDYAISPDSSEVAVAMNVDLDQATSTNADAYVVPTGGGSRNIIAGASTLDDVQFNSDGRTIIYTEVSGSHPTEIYRATSTGGAGVPLTHLNDAVLANDAIAPLEEMYADSPDKTRVH